VNDPRVYSRDSVGGAPPKRAGRRRLAAAVILLTVLAAFCAVAVRRIHWISWHVGSLVRTSSHDELALLAIGAWATSLVAATVSGFWILRRSPHAWLGLLSTGFAGLVGVAAYLGFRVAWHGLRGIPISSAELAGEIAVDFVGILAVGFAAAIVRWLPEQRP
jgi:hypothetical protein